MSDTSTRFSLKDHLFNEVKVRYLAQLLAAADTSFDKEAFVLEVMSRLLRLELKDRIRWIADVLSRSLPEDYSQAVGVIIGALPPPLDPHKTDDDFGDFIFAPFGEYIAMHGCTRERLTVSLRALREITKRFSMEDAIRVFLRTFPDETLGVMRSWAIDEHYHVRRLVSEGTRPLLPWSGRVPLVSADTIPLLTILHADSTRFVTRSVANHLNDIAKREPMVVIDTLRAWQKMGKQNQKELAWMTKHALRTLIKRGHGEALSLLGYASDAYQVDQFAVVTATVRSGEVLTFNTTLTAKADANFLIDYLIHFVKKNDRTVPKVFKWKTVSLKRGESLQLRKNHRLKADATTFSLYPGEHKIELQINGVIAGVANFMLKR